MWCAAPAAAAAEPRMATATLATTVSGGDEGFTGEWCTPVNRCTHMYMYRVTGHTHVHVCDTLQVQGSTATWCPPTWCFICKRDNKAETCGLCSNSLLSFCQSALSADSTLRISLIARRACCYGEQHYLHSKTHYGTGRAVLRDKRCCGQTAAVPVNRSWTEHRIGHIKSTLKQYWDFAAVWNAVFVPP